MMSRIKDVLLIAFVTTLGVIVYRKYKGEKKSSFVEDLMKNFGNTDTTNVDANAKKTNIINFTR